MITHTTAEVAARLRVGPRKVRKVAQELGVGLDMKGRAGWRYTEADVEAIMDALRPVQAVPARRRRRRAA